MSRTAYEDFLECMICFEEVNNAHLCPLCARVACLKCWKNATIDEICSYCRQSIKGMRLVKCGWYADFVKSFKINNEEYLQSKNDLAIKRSKFFEEKQEYVENMRGLKQSLKAFEQVKMDVKKASDKLQSEMAALQKKKEAFNIFVKPFVETKWSSPLAADRINFHLGKITDDLEKLTCDHGDDSIKEQLTVTLLKMAGMLNNLSDGLLALKKTLKNDQ